MDRSVAMARSVALLLLSLFFLSCILSCRGFSVEELGSQKDLSQGSPRQLGIEEQAAAIEQLYSPLTCFSARFQLLAISAGDSQRVNGTIRRDEKGERTLLVFQLPLLRLELSRMLIERDVVFLKERNGKKRRLPKKDFYLRRSGLYSSSLPLSLFDDLLYGRLPKELFSRPAQISQEGQYLSVDLAKGANRLIYRFHKNRLEHLQVLSARSDRSDRPDRSNRSANRSDRSNRSDHSGRSNRSGAGNSTVGQPVNIPVEISFIGAYRDTRFPRQIKVASRSFRGERERLELSFSRFNLQADCRDAHFAI